MEISTHDLRMAIRISLWRGVSIGFIVGLLIGLGIQKAQASADDVEMLPSAPMEKREDAMLAHSHSDGCCTLDQRIEVASINPTSEGTSGKSTAVLDQYLIDEIRPLHLIDSIINVPGVVTKTITGLGSVRVRGARSFDTKYLYDGFPLRDPSHPQNSFGSFFGDTLTFGHSQIEILKGPSSVLYGSEAIGGVIDIEPIDIDTNTIDIEYGSNETVTGRINTSPVTLAYSDSQDYGTANLRLSHDFDGVKPFLIYQETEAPLHNAPFIAGIVTHDERDENDRRETRYIQTGVALENEYITSKLSYSNSDRRFVFLPNTDGTGFWNDGSFIGESVFFDVHGKLQDTTVGYSFQRDWLGITSEGLDSDTSDLYQNDIYIEHSLWLQDIYVLLGARHSIHEHSKDRATYDISASYNLDGYILRGHYGTGFRAPSLYELNGAFLTSFGRFYIGNENLSPERSSSLDFGVEKTWDDKITANITVFSHRLTNRIDFVGSGYSNLDGPVDTYGYEAFYEHFLFGNTSARISYTRTVQPDLVDIPQHLVEASIRTVKKNWSVIVSSAWRDRHEVALFDMSTFTVGRSSEDGYISANLMAEYKVRDNVSIYGRLENILDETYFDGGYRQDGFSAYMGVRVEI